MSGGQWATGPAWTTPACSTNWSTAGHVLPVLDWDDEMPPARGLAALNDFGADRP
jgi:hypothetical protein